LNAMKLLNLAFFIFDQKLLRSFHIASIKFQGLDRTLFSNEIMFLNNLKLGSIQDIVLTSLQGIEGSFIIFLRVYCQSL
jgi:hypothetical protein